MAKVVAAKDGRSLYSVHPGVAMVQKWAAELKDKTGRSVDEWVAVIQKQAPESTKDRREWLKNMHRLGSNSAWWLVDRAEGRGAEEESPEAYLKAAVKYVEGQYQGAKEALKPIYDQLLRLGKSLGADVKACPCQTMVPLYRNHVFAQIKPTTNSRVDLGLALAHYSGKLPKRLVDTGGLKKKDRITHRIEVTTLTDIDEVVRKWLKTAYQLDEKD